MKQLSSLETLFKAAADYRAKAASLPAAAISVGVAASLPDVDAVIQTLSGVGQVGGSVTASNTVGQLSFSSFTIQSIAGTAAFQVGANGVAQIFSSVLGSVSTARAFGFAAAFGSGFVSDGSGAVIGLGSGANVSSGAYFASYVGTTGGGVLPGPGFGTSGNVGFAEGTPTLVGFRFQIAGSTHYGVAEMSIVHSMSASIGPGGFASSAASLTIGDIAWNDVPGEGIVLNGTTINDVEAVPEPAGLGALAAGAAGLIAWRRRRAA